MVWVLAAGLALLALGMGLKVALLRHGMKALRRDLVERRGQVLALQQLQVPGDGRERRAQVVGDVHHRLLQLLVPLLVPQPLLPQGPQLLV